MDRAAIGRIVRERRQSLGWSLRQAAPRCGVSFTMLGQIETAETNTTVDTLEAVARGLGTDLYVSLGQPSTSHELPPDLRQDVSELLSALTSPDESMASRARVGLELLVSGLKGGGR